MPAGSVCTIFTVAASTVVSGATFEGRSLQGARSKQSAKGGINSKELRAPIATLEAWKDVVWWKLVLSCLDNSAVAARRAKEADIRLKRTLEASRIAGHDNFVPTPPPAPSRCVPQASGEDTYLHRQLREMRRGKMRQDGCAFNSLQRRIRRSALVGPLPAQQCV